MSLGLVALALVSGEIWLVALLRLLVRLVTLTGTRLKISFVLGLVLRLVTLLITFGKNFNVCCVPCSVLNEGIDVAFFYFDVF